MQNLVTIYCKNIKQFVQIPCGTSLKELYAQLHLELAYPVIAARVNYKVQNLNFLIYKPKDIVLYLRDENTPVLHRIMRKKDKGFAICGDNQNVMEYPVPEENVLGRVYEFERKGKRITTDNFLYRIYSTIWGLGLKHRRAILHFPLKILAKKREKSKLK